MAIAGAGVASTAATLAASRLPRQRARGAKGKVRRLHGGLRGCCVMGMGCFLKALSENSPGGSLASTDSGCVFSLGRGAPAASAALLRPYGRVGTM